MFTVGSSGKDLGLCFRSQANNARSSIQYNYENELRPPTRGDHVIM